MSLERPSDPPIIIRRHRHAEEPHHGGAWKVAFADFMTAMMAFFLVLWIINSVTKDARASIARYFNPVSLSDTTVARRGLRSPKDFELDPQATNTELRDAEAASSTKAESIPTKQKTRDGAPPSMAGKDTALSERDPFLLLDQIAARAAGETSSDGLAPSPAAEVAGDGPHSYRDPFAPSLPSQAEPPILGASARKGGAKAQAPATEKREKNEPSESAVEVLRREIGQALREAGLPVETHLRVAKVDEGLLVSLMDDARFGMFAIGSEEPLPVAVRAMEKVGRVLAARGEKLVIRGHTDARPFRARASDNWRLSSSRARMAAYMLMRGGLDEKRILRIEGHADRDPRNAADPLAAENRRIDILLRSG